MKQQYQIVKKKVLTPEISQISVHAPLVAAKAKAGQFIILRVDENGERIPLTISSADQENGTITVIFQKVGGTTLALDQLNEGDCLHDFVGPLGEATHVEDLGRVAVLGGGLGCAIALPVARALHEAGNQVDLIGGFKTKDIAWRRRCPTPAPTFISAPTTAPMAITVSSPASWRSSSRAGSSSTTSLPSAP